MSIVLVSFFLDTKTGEKNHLALSKKRVIFNKNFASNQDVVFQTIFVFSPPCRIGSHLALAATDSSGGQWGSDFSQLLIAAGSQCKKICASKSASRKNRN